MFSFDARTVAPQTAMEPVPLGWYKCIIVKSNIKPTKNDTSQAFLELVLKIIEGQFADRQVYINLNIFNQSQQAVEIAYKQLSAICHVIGQYNVQAQQNAPDMTTPMLHNIPFMAYIVVGTGTNGPNNNVKGFKDIAGNDPGKQGQAQTIPGGAPQGFGAQPQPGQAQPGGTWAGPQGGMAPGGNMPYGGAAPQQQGGGWPGGGPQPQQQPNPQPQYQQPNPAPQGNGGWSTGPAQPQATPNYQPPPPNQQPQQPQQFAQPQPQQAQPQQPQYQQAAPQGQPQYQQPQPGQFQPQQGPGPQGGPAGAAPWSR